MAPLGNSGMKHWSLMLIATVFALGTDVLTKRWAEQALEFHDPFPIVGNLFRLSLGYNTGAAFGLFANSGTPLLLITGLIIVGLLFWLLVMLRGANWRPTLWLPVGLVLGGAMANFLDRLPDGRVTDFLDVGLGAARWPTFNLADSFIVIGIGFLALMSFSQRNSTEVAGT